MQELGSVTASFCRFQIYKARAHRCRCRSLRGVVPTLHLCVHESCIAHKTGELRKLNCSQAATALLECSLSRCWLKSRARPARAADSAMGVARVWGAWAVPIGKDVSFCSRRLAGRDKITRVTHRCHSVYTIGWRDVRRRVVEFGGGNQSRRSKRPPEMISPGAFCRPFAISYIAVKSSWFGSSTIDRNVRTHCSLLPRCVRLKLWYSAISASAITDANSAIE